MAQVQSAVISIAANLATGSVTSAKILDATVASADLDPTTIQYAAVSIAAGAVATLRGTPVQLVAAPGSGLILEFISATLLLDWVTPGFTETDDNRSSCGYDHYWRSQERCHCRGSFRRQ